MARYIRLIDMVKIVKYVYDPHISNYEVFLASVALTIGHLAWLSWYSYDSYHMKLFENAIHHSLYMYNICNPQISKYEVNSCLSGSDHLLRNSHACARLPSVWCRHHHFFTFVEKIIRNLYFHIEKVIYAYFSYILPWRGLSNGKVASSISNPSSVYNFHPHYLMNC